MVWAVIFYKLIFDLLTGPYAELFDSEEKANNYLENVKHNGWEARITHLQIK